MSETARPNGPSDMGGGNGIDVDATDLAIRQLLDASDTPEIEASNLPEPPRRRMASAPQPRAPAPVVDAGSVPHEMSEPLSEEPRAKDRRLSRWATFAKLWLRGFLRRPDAPRLLAIVLLAAAFIAKPWFVVFLAVFAVILAVSVAAYLGFDTVAERIALWHERLSQRDPDRAEAIRARAARASKVASKLIARLPEHWTEGLYLPDFEKGEPPSAKLKDDPFEKLARQVSQARS